MVDSATAQLQAKCGLASSRFANVRSSCHSILVLWGKGFDEIAASIFLAELRRMGKRVKLVGLNSQHSAGQHGVTLVPDLPLGQALRMANKVCCLIVPAPLSVLQQFSYDPRIAELLGLSTNNGALFVVHHTHARGLEQVQRDDSTESFPFLIAGEHVLEYPETDALLNFVQGPLRARLA